MIAKYIQPEPDIWSSRLQGQLFISLDWLNRYYVKIHCLFDQTQEFSGESDFVMFSILINVDCSFVFCQIKVLLLRMKNIVVGRKTKMNYFFSSVYGWLIEIDFINYYKFLNPLLLGKTANHCFHFNIWTEKSGWQKSSGKNKFVDLTKNWTCEKRKVAILQITALPIP